MRSLHVASISALLSSIVTWKVTLESGMTHVEEANPQEQPLQPDQPFQPQDEISEEALPDETVPAPEPEPWLRLANIVMMVAPAEGEYAKLRWLLFGGEIIMLLWSTLAILARILNTVVVRCCRPRKRPLLEPMASPGPGGTLISDTESVEWLNQGLKVLWPHISKVVRQELIDNVLPKLDKDLKGLGGMLKVKRFSLGEDTPVVSNFRMLRKNRGLIARATVKLQAAVDIEFSATVATVGISAVHLNGDVEVALEPILDKVPLFGAVCIGFIDPPDMKLDFKGVLVAANNDVVRHALNALVVQKLVLPNRVIVQLSEDPQVDPAALAVPEPVGVLRVAALSARNLLAGDWHIHKAATSDAYVQARLGSESWRSPTAPPTCHPTWDSSKDYLFLAFHDELRLLIDVYDEDKMSADDHLGTLRPIPLCEAHQHSNRPLQLYITEPADKQGEACGTLRVQLENYNLTSGEVGLQMSLVIVRVKKVFLLPRTHGRRATIEVELNEKKQIIRSGTATIVKVEQYQHVDDVLKQVAERLMEDGKDSSATAGLLGITQNDLKKLMTTPTDAVRKGGERRRDSSQGDPAAPSIAASGKEAEEERCEQVVLGGAAHFIEKTDGLGNQELRLSLSGRWGGRFGTYAVQISKVLGEPGLCSPGPIEFTSVKAGEPKIEADIEVAVVGLSAN